MIGADLEPIEAQQIQTQPTRHIALKISYLGWTYAGLASQEHQMRANGAPRSSIPDTVESRLLDALEKAMLIASRDPIEINMAKCGRTDKGVSSFAQVFSLDVKSKLSLEDLSVERDLLEKNGTLSEDEVQSIRENEIPYTAILNALLPSDIRALGWSPVSPTFDARFACSGR